MRGDLSSPDTLGPALRDVDSVYLMWPGIPVEPAVVDAIAGHAKRVVYLSADVAELADGEEATIYHQEIERLIRKSGREVRWEEPPLETARAELTAAWGNAAFVEARLAAWKAFVDSPERVTDTVERLL